ncbi:hypothetical protein [Phenylobacterium sp.]|uniref:hypothetical protein n=1 Tax=Phenylobacterium sp. TaxID=1871053 RepID=UPI002DED3AFF|nr:hypothetical protein [Phenylobacterium sp.]
MNRLLVLAATCAVLSACATRAPALKAVCPPVRPYSLAEQQALATALAALPPGSPLAQAMVDYGRERAALRACAQSSTPGRTP